MAIEVRRALPQEYEEAGRVTALAYREFVRPEDADWNRYLDRIADVGGRARRTVVLVAVEDGRILGSATLELEGRTEEGEPPVPPDEARRAGKRRLTLNTTQRMRAAQAMYEALGFERMEDRVFPDGFVLLGYQKPLDT